MPVSCCWSPGAQRLGQQPLIRPDRDHPAGPTAHALRSTAHGSPRLRLGPRALGLARPWLRLGAWPLATGDASWPLDPRALAGPWAELVLDRRSLGSLSPTPSGLPHYRTENRPFERHRPGPGTAGPHRQQRSPGRERNGHCKLPRLLALASRLLGMPTRPGTSPRRVSCGSGNRRRAGAASRRASIPGCIGSR